MRWTRSLQLRLPPLSILPWETVLLLRIGEPRLLPSEIIDPSPGALEPWLYSSLVPLTCKVIPSQSIAHSSDLITDSCPRLLAHPHVQIIVAKQILQVLSDRLPITWLNQEAVNTIFDLEGNASCFGGDDRTASMEGFRDLDLKALPGGELKDNVGVRNEGIEELIVGLKTHDGTVGDQMGIAAFKLGHGVIIYYASIRIVN